MKASCDQSALARITLSFLVVATQVEGLAWAGVAESASAPRQTAALDLRIPEDPDAITIFGEREYLYESDRKLARLKSALPGLGTDVAPQGSFAENLVEKWRKGRDFDALSPAQQSFFQRVLGINEGPGK